MLYMLVPLVQKQCLGHDKCSTIVVKENNEKGKRKEEKICNMNVLEGERLNSNFISKKEKSRQKIGSFLFRWNNSS